LPVVEVSSGVKRSAAETAFNACDRSSDGSADPTSHGREFRSVIGEQQCDGSVGGLLRVLTSASPVGALAVYSIAVAEQERAIVPSATDLPLARRRDATLAGACPAFASARVPRTR